MTATLLPRVPRRDRARVTDEVAFCDVDSLDVVWHGHYFRYFEVARTRLFRDFGALEAMTRLERYKWVIIESGCRHLQPLRFGDHFTVEAWLTEIEYRIALRYEVTREDGVRVARAFTHLATLDLEGKLCLVTPPELLEYLVEPSVVAEKSP